MHIEEMQRTITGSIGQTEKNENMKNPSKYRVTAYTEQEDKDFYFSSEKAAREELAIHWNIRHMNEYYNLHLSVWDADYDQYMEIKTNKSINNY